MGETFGEQSEALSGESKALLTGAEAVARLEEQIVGNGAVRDPATAEGLAMAGIRAASLAERVTPANQLFPAIGAQDVILPDVSCVHHAFAEPGQAGGGAFELAAGSAQEALDQCLAAHILSRRLSRSGLCSLAPVLAEELGFVSVPDADFISALLDRELEATEPEADSERVVTLTAEALANVDRGVGRPAVLVRREGGTGTEIVLLAAGAATSAARALYEALGDAGVSAGLASLQLVRPFPVRAVREALAGASSVFVIGEATGSSALLDAVRAAAAEQARVAPLPAGPPDELLAAIQGCLPDVKLDSERPYPAAVSEPCPHRLVIAPSGPWSQGTARGILGVLGRSGSLRVDGRNCSQLGTVLAWGSGSEEKKVGGEDGSRDLLIAAEPSLLENSDALALVSPGSSVLLLSDARSARELAQLLSDETRSLLRERDLDLYWMAPLRSDPEDVAAREGERTSQAALTEAALALITGGGAQPGLVDLEELERATQSKELDFRPATVLPHMPAAPDSERTNESWARWIRRFHLRGAGAFAPAPQLPLRPVALDDLNRRLRGGSPRSFVLFPSGDSEQPIVARGLEELLDEAARSGEDLGRGSRALGRNIEALTALVARRIDDGKSGAEIRTSTEAAGEELLRLLSLSEEDKTAFEADLTALRGELPAEGHVLGLNSDTPLRLYLEVQAAVAAPLRECFTERLKGLRERLRDLLQLDRMVSEAGRAPAVVAASFGSGAANRLDPAAIGRVLPREATSATLEPDRRQRIERALETIERYLDEPMRHPGVVFLHPPEVGLSLTGDSDRARSGVEQRTHPDPLSAAVGYFDGTAQRMAELFRAVRVASLEGEGAYETALHAEGLAELSWEAFSAEELALLPRVAVVITGSRLRHRDQGALSELLRSSRPVHVIVRDEIGAVDEARDLSAFHVDLGALVMAHREVFAVSSTLARPDRLVQGLVRLMRAPRPGVVLVHLPTREPAPLLAAAALHGRACPDFCYDPDAGASWADRFDIEGNPQPECAWPIYHFSYLEGENEREIDLAFTFADAVALEPAYSGHMRLIPRCAWDDAAQRPMDEVLDLIEEENHEHAIPYLWVRDEEGALQRAIVTRELTMACRDRLRAWRVLQELGGFENAYAERAAAAARERALADAAREREALEQQHSEELAQARGEGARESMERLADALTSPGGIAAAVAAPREPVTRASSTAAESKVTAETPGAAEAPGRASDEEEEEESLLLDEPYVTTALCTSCNECTNINSRLFQYNADKQAFIADATAGTFAELVASAEKCPARCIHPGKPRSDDATASSQLIERAAKFN